MQPHVYVIAIGSNRRHGRHGMPAAVVRASIGAIEAAGPEILARSPIIITPALGPAGRSFANAAITIRTPIDPPALLRLLKKIEVDFGRRRGRRWGQRVLDLDIILWSGGRWHSNRPRLTVPHREATKRLFVLRPLLSIAGDWRLGQGRVRHAHRRLEARRAG